MSSLSRPLFDSGNLHLFVQLAVEHPGARERHLPAVMACLRKDVRVEQAMHALLVAAQQAPAAARPSNCELISSYFSAIGSPNDGCFHGHAPDAPMPAHECAGCGTQQHQFVESPVRTLDCEDGNECDTHGHEDYAHSDHDGAHGYEVELDDDVAIASGTSPSATMPPAPINTRPLSPPAALELPLSPCYVSPSYDSPLLSDVDFDEGPATPLDLHADLDADVGIVCPVSPFATPLDLSSHLSRGLPPPTPSYTTMPRVMRVLDSDNEDAADASSGSASPAPSLVFDSYPSSPSPGPVRRSQRMRRHSPYLRPSKDQRRKPKIKLDRDVSPFDLDNDESIYAYSPKVAADLLYTPPVYAPEAFSTTRGGCDELFLYSSSSESESESGSESEAPSLSSSCASSRASSPGSRASRSPRFDPLSRGGRRAATSL